MNTLSCIKCGQQYQSDEEENYYCPACLIEHKRIAAEVDARLASSPRKEIISDYQIYKNAPKIRGFADARNFI